jgi:hypothetical protein
VAVLPKNYLIHVYKERHNLEPFKNAEEFFTIRDFIKRSIWASYKEHGIDKDLVVKDFVFKREDKIGLVFCTSEVRQLRIIQLIIDIGLGSHIIESEDDLFAGMKMSFRKPQFGPQEIGPLLEAIFTLNDLDGRAGSREQRTDRPKGKEAYTVCTVHFPQNALEYAKQRDFKLTGPDGLITLYGSAVTARRRANFEAAEDRRKANEEWQREHPTPPTLKHPQVIAPLRPPEPALREALIASIAAGKTCTIATVLIPAAVAGQPNVLAAPFPHALMAVVNLTMDYPDGPPLESEGSFELLSKSKHQRWIRKLKVYAACLRAAHRIDENSTITTEAMDDNEGKAAPEAANPGEAMPATEAEHVQERQEDEEAPVADCQGSGEAMDAN